MDSSDSSRRFLEMFEPHVPAWSRVFAERSDREQEPKDWTDLFPTKNPIEPEEADIVKPEVAKWREWRVTEHVISRALGQRASASKLRAEEEYVEVEGFAYLMPRLPLLEKEAWGVAKSIEFEGSIYVREAFSVDRLYGRFRYTYQRPKITIEARTYEIIEEIASMMHVSVLILHVFDARLGMKVITYRAQATGARAVRVAYLIEPHLKHPEKKSRAKLILETYRARPEVTA